MDEVIIRRREPEKWVPVWWNRVTYGVHQRIRAIAGNPSKTGKTVRIRARFSSGDMVERSISPKNLEPRTARSGEGK